MLLKAKDYFYQDFCFVLVWFFGAQDGFQGLLVHLYTLGFGFVCLP
jgi:hypothetical protein